MASPVLIPDSAPPFGRVNFRPKKLIEYKNHIFNSSMDGAGPGMLPDYWSPSVDGGLTQTIIGKEIIGGINCIDIRFNGVTTGLEVIIRPEPFNRILVSDGQSWAMSNFIAIIGGSKNNIVKFDFQIIEWTSGGMLLSAHVSPSFLGLITDELQRFVFSTVLNGGPTVYSIQPRLRFVVANASAVDFTVRIGIPQMELGKFANFPMLTP